MVSKMINMEEEVSNKKFVFLIIKNNFRINIKKLYQKCKEKGIEYKEMIEILNRLSSINIIRTYGNIIEYDGEY